MNLNKRTTAFIIGVLGILMLSIPAFAEYASTRAWM